MTEGEQVSEATRHLLPFRSLFLGVELGEVVQEYAALLVESLFKEADQVFLLGVKFLQGVLDVSLPSKHRRKLVVCLQVCQRREVPLLIRLIHEVIAPHVLLNLKVIV